MIINYLQTRSPKILPNLQQPPHNKITTASGQCSRTSFGDDLERLKGFGVANKESLGDLLFGFFRRYGHEVNYERDVISVREGALISKQLKKWHLLQNNRLGVEEPFNVERNLGNTADDTSFRGVHLELRRAFEFVSQGRLNECCEQYEFPVYEEKFWSRPAPQPRPILTRSQSQTGRSFKGGSSGNGKGSTNPGGQRHRSGTTTTSRRASSAAAMNKLTGYPVMTNGERSMSNNHIHDHLIHHYQLLQHQEQQLRLQMHQRAQATLHAQATAQVPAQVHQSQSLQVQTIPYAQQVGSDNHRRHSNLDPPPLSAPLRTVQAYYYPVPMMNHQGSPSMPSSQSITSPSSPSQAAAQLVPPELRRSAHRSGTTDSNGALRSHSQPPASMKIISQNSRPLLPTNQPYATPQGQLQGYSTLQQYQQAYLQGRRSGETFQPTPESSEVGSQSGSSFYEQPWVQEPSLREYMGYYMDPAALDRSRDRNGLSPETLASSDSGHRARTVSPNLSRLRRQSSRSPSPSHSSASAGHAINFYSSESPPFQHYSRGMMGEPNQASGPVIVDGSSDTSDYAMPPDVSFPSVNSGSASITSDERPINTPTSGSAVITPFQDPTDPIQLDGHSEGRSATYTPSILQFGEFPARATFRSPAQAPRSDDGRTPEKSAPVPVIRRETVAGAGGTNGLGIGVDSNKTQDISSFGNGSTQRTMHNSSTLSGLNLASSLKPLATLSPVREVRTPSPTAIRSQLTPGENSVKDLHGRSSSLTAGKRTEMSPLATNSSAYLDLNNVKPTAPKDEAVKTTESKGKDTQRLPNGVPPHSPLKSSPISSSLQEQQTQPKQQLLQTSGWQQSTSKKKKSKKSASVGSASIPLDPNERKGG